MPKRRHCQRKRDLVAFRVDTCVGKHVPPDGKEILNRVVWLTRLRQKPKPGAIIINSLNVPCKKQRAEAGIGNRVEKERDRFNGELRLTLHTRERQRVRETHRNTLFKNMLYLYALYIRVFNEHVLYKS